MASHRRSSPSLVLSSCMLVLMLAVFAGHLAYYYPQLPDKVASHFGARGQPDNWSSKQTYAIGMLAVAGVLALTFLILGPFMRSVPDGMINLPNRDHWLAPQRRAATLAAFARALHWIGVATLALLVAVNHLVVNANLRSNAQLSPTVWVCLAVYLVFMILCLTRMLWRFRITPDPSRE